MTIAVLGLKTGYGNQPHPKINCFRETFQSCDITLFPSCQKVSKLFETT